MKMSASDHGRNGGRPTKGDLTRRLTAEDMSRDGYGWAYSTVKGGYSGYSTVAKRTIVIVDS